jgi:very-short-patch-repair endonuclease
MADRTRAELTSRQRGFSWLGNASLEEYAVGAWLEANSFKGLYIYQGTFGGYRRKIRTDFLMLTGRSLCIEVQGDHFHQGAADVVADRLRRILLQEQGALVVEVWGHDIVYYDGYETPTDESFDEMMTAAVEGIQTSYRNG